MWLSLIKLYTFYGADVSENNYKDGKIIITESSDNDDNDELLILYHVYVSCK